MGKEALLTVAYARVSTEYQWTEVQRSSLQELIDREDGPVIFLEEVVSGRKMKGEKLQYLKTLIEADKVQKVIVWAYDRLGRNLLEGCKFIELCLKHGVSLVSKCEPWDISTPEGKMLFHNCMTHAEYTCGKVSRNTARGLDLAKQRGTFVGGTPKGSNWIAAKTKAKLPRVYNLLSKGNTSKDIAKIVEMDERTVARLIKLKDSPPDVRERVWDA